MASQNEQEEVIRSAKQAGADDKVIITLFMGRGWSSREAYSALASYYEKSLGLHLGAKKREASSNPLDGFLYFMAVGILTTWVISSLVTWSQLVSSWFPEVGSFATKDFRYSSYEADWNISVLILMTPILIVLLSVLHKRLEREVTSYASPVRLWILSIALVMTVTTILGYLVACLQAFLGGSPERNFLLNIGFGILLLSGVAAYLLIWLRAGKEAAL